ncbi:phage tail domain-containing protein [Micromonospora pisi]|uniref:phage tail domain-containing protein n=1 Tax=Micromonospora pisi TaxID=589240 RepID=UPI001476A0D8|nr:phage tail domain-containing protein [Micromonospora pisi]
MDEPDRGYCTLNDVTGLGATEGELTADPHPWGGTTIRHFFKSERIINWPLAVYAHTHRDYNNLWQSLVRVLAMTRTRGPGLLQIAQPEGTVREIEVVCTAGLKVAPGHGRNSNIAVLALYCADPHWRDPEPTVVEREFAVGGSPYLAPYPSISSSRVLGDTTIDNPGEVEAWPEWEIDGPASSIVATNLTTGLSFTLNPDWNGDGPLAAGETVTITTFPPRLRGPAGQVWTGALDWTGARLWPLAPGTNSVRFEVAGANVGTRISLSFRARYETE